MVSDPRSGPATWPSPLALLRSTAPSVIGDRLPVDGIAQVAERPAVDAVLQKRDVAVEKDDVHPARVRTGQFIVRAAIIGGPRAVRAATDGRLPLVDVWPGLVQEERIVGVAGRRA